MIDLSYISKILNFKIKINKISDKILYKTNIELKYLKIY